MKKLVFCFVLLLTAANIAFATKPKLPKDGWYTCDNFIKAISKSDYLPEHIEASKVQCSMYITKLERADDLILGALGTKLMYWAGKTTDVKVKDGFPEEIKFKVTHISDRTSYRCHEKYTISVAEFDKDFSLTNNRSPRMRECN